MSFGEATALGLSRRRSEAVRACVTAGTAISRIVRGGGPSAREVWLAVVAVVAGIVVLAATTHAGTGARLGRTMAVACDIGIPGYARVHGTGTSTLAANGATRSLCHARLPVGAAPAKTLRYQVGPCTIRVETDGRVVGTCRSTNPR
jgi:hypothetical protein